MNLTVSDSSRPIAKMPTGLAGHRLLDLQNAILKGNKKDVMEMLKQGYFPRPKNEPLELSRLPNGEFPLHLAVRCGYADIVELLVKNGVDPSIKDAQGLSAIDLAVQIGNKKLFTAILGTQIGKDVLEARERLKASETDLASHFDRLRKEVDRFSTFKGKNISDVCEAAYLGMLNGTPLLEKLDNEGFAPIHYAAMRNDWHVFDVLAPRIEQNAQFRYESIAPVSNAPVETPPIANIFPKLSPADQPAPYKPPMSAELIAEIDEPRPPAYNPAVMPPNSASQTSQPPAFNPLWTKSKEQPKSEPIEELPKIPNPTLQFSTAKGDTPLHLAAACGSTESVQKLIELGANPNAANFQGQTPLHYAAIGDHLPAFRSLIDKGASPLLQDFEGANPLALFGASAASRDPLSISKTDLALFGASSVYWLSRFAGSPLSPLLHTASAFGIHAAALGFAADSAGEIVKKAADTVESVAGKWNIPFHIPIENSWLKLAGAGAVLAASYATPWVSIPLQAYGTYKAAQAAIGGLKACQKNKDYRRLKVELKTVIHGMNLVMPFYIGGISALKAFKIL